MSPFQIRCVSPPPTRPLADGTPEISPEIQTHMRTSLQVSVGFAARQQKQQYLMGYSRYIIFSDFKRVEEPPAVVCGSRSLTWNTALLAVAFVLSCRLTEEFAWIINVLPNLGAGWAVAILFNISTSFCNSKMRTNLSLLTDI